MTDIGLYLKPGTPFFVSADLAFDDAERYPLTFAELPPGWRRSCPSTGAWTMVHGPEPLPAAGWKVHVAAVSAEAGEVLTRVAQLCFELGVSFKHLASPRVFETLSGKYAPRSSSGKFITVFPADAAQADAVVARLTAALQGRRGPRILTDIDIEGGPVHVRFGAFRELWTVLPSGMDALAYPGPEGDLVPDARRLAFSVPENVEVPRCVMGARERRERLAAVRTLPYAVSKSMHFSAAGGVYKGTTNEGIDVAVKEGRRHAGIGLDGTDAAQRLRHEFETLTELSGEPGVPGVLAWHEFEDRVFMAQEFIPGCRAIEFVAQFHPGGRADASPAEVRHYAERVQALVTKVRDTVGVLHRRGLAFGDLHPGNLLIGDDDTVTLVDFETVHSAEGELTTAFTVAPGYRVGATSPIAADLLRLDLIHLWFLTPENTYWEFSDKILDRSIREARHRFGLSEDVFAALASATGPKVPAVDWGPVEPVATNLPWTDLETRAEECLLSFPADDPARSPMPVGPGALPWSFARGAAGAIWSVRHASSPRVATLVDWLEAAATGSTRKVPGLFDGYAGAAAVLHDCGSQGAALILLERAVALSSDVTNPDLRNGLAGVGLAALRVGRPDIAGELAARIAQLLKWGAPLGRGLGAGGSGIAIFAVRMHESSGDERWLELADRALRLDLRHLVSRPDGTALLDQGNGKHLPDVLGGTLGVAFAIRELAGYRASTAQSRVLAAAGRVCQADGWATQGLLDGRSGAVAFAARQEGALASSVVKRQSESLRGYFCQIGDRLHFPGLLGLRFSCDLESGLSGALHALRVAADPAEQPLPLLGPLVGQPSFHHAQEGSCHV